MRGDVLLLVVRSLRYRRHFSGGARDGEGTPKILLAFVGAEVVRKLYGYLMDMGAWRNASCPTPGCNKSNCSLFQRLGINWPFARNQRTRLGNAPQQQRGMR